VNGVPPEAQLWRLVRGAMGTQALKVVADARIADALASGARPVDELAAEAGLEPDALYRFLRALATDGVFAEGETRVFRNTPASELLRTDGEQRWHEFALQFARDWYTAFAEAPAAARTGEAVFPLVFGVDFEERLRNEPNALALFNRSMEAGANERIERIANLPWSDEVVVDVGGGTGSMLIELLRRNPRLRGVLFDLPEVVMEARPRVEATEVSERCELVAGSFHDAVPAGDAYALSRILHGMDDERAAGILQNVRRAAHPRARVLIFDSVVPQGNEPHGSKWLDLLMLVLSGGRERTEDEWRRLLAREGLEPERLEDGLVEAAIGQKK